MNHIIYGESKIEREIFKRVRKRFNSDEILKVSSDAELDEALKVAKFKPFFNNSWLLVVNLDKLDKDHYITAIKQLKNPKVVCYYRIPRDTARFTSIMKSDTMKKLEDLVILNSKFPSKDFVGRLLLNGVKKVFDDAVINYIYNELKFNIDELDNVIDKMNDYELNEITLKDIKILLPKSKTKDVKSLCYSILLVHKPELKERWKEKDMKVVVGNSGVKVKPYKILEEIDMKPEYLLKFICDIFKNMVRVRKLYSEGSLTETNVFKDKDKFAKDHAFLQHLSVPAIRDFIFVSREVTINEIQYCLNEFLFLRQKSDLTMDDIYFVVYKLMNRHNNTTNKKNE